ncbi:MAG: ATP-binding protein [Chloroflexota bacterium]
MRFFKSIRFRLTVWYLIVIVVLLAIFGTVAYFTLSHNLYQNLDNSLETRVNELRTTLVIERGRAVFAGQPDELLLIYNTDGTLQQSFGPSTEFTNIDSLVTQALDGQSSFLTATTGNGERIRLYGVPFPFGPFTRVAIIVGRPTTEIEGVLGMFRIILGFSGLAVFVLAAVGGVFLAGRALKPVERITRTAQAIGETDLSQRINVHSEDELGRLASTLNRMIERLETAFTRQRQFTADASHELRTPLAIMEAESTLALSKERTDAEYRKSLELVSQEISYMSAIIGKLLFLARSDTGKEPLNLEEINLKEVLTGLASDVEALARDKGLQFMLGPLEDLTVRGDRVKLRQLFLNIFENAIRYTPDGGSISDSLVRKDGMALVAISDTGIGIAPEHLPHIFERFYRVDKARSRAEGGAGLGLAIARHITETHGGKITVESQVGKGTTFYISLPLSN